MTPPPHLLKVYRSIDALLTYAQEYLDLDTRDITLTRNRLFEIFSLNSYPGAEKVRAVLDSDEGAKPAPSSPSGANPARGGRPDSVLNEFLDACENAALIEPGGRAALADRVMGIVSSPPSVIRTKFAALSAAAGGRAAMEWFYNYGVANDYVKRSVLDRNPRFESQGLIITINLAKPEFKDPRTAASGNSLAGGYPKCTICPENEGFAGRSKATLRTVPLRLAGQDWFWQFSPYGYFTQHGIAVNTKHIPMHIDEATFDRLMDFVDTFPGYFIGCNATLPRIGGSVLGHDHYQGGLETLPLHTTPARQSYTSAEECAVVLESVEWPGSVLRVVGRDRAAVRRASYGITRAWNAYTNERLGIISRDAEGQHSGVSPTCVRTERGYEMNIILRSNITSERYPQGVFHAHPEFFPVKQESIGLIEAQGLFILPARLQRQLALLAQALEDGRGLPEELPEFAMIFEEIRRLLGEARDKESVEDAIRTELGSVCVRILENTAVFPSEADTASFLAECGWYPQA